LGFAKADDKSLFIAVQRVKIKRTEEGEVIRMVDRELLQAISNMLDSRFGGLETRFNKIDSRFGGLETRFNKLDSRFEGLEAGFNKIDSRVEGLEAGVNKIDSRVEGLEARFNKIDSRFGGLETRFNKIDSRFEGLETRFNKIDSRFGGLETRFNKRLRSTENSILQQLDIVQEKSNNNYHMLEDKLEGLRVIVNGIKIDHDTVNLLSENVSNLHYEIHKLKIKLS
jgi:archaellum component FlaC